jgi:hypothetical protein
MMAIPINQYHALWAKRAQKLRAGVKKGTVDTAKFITAMARSMAPRSSGRLLASIRRQGSMVKAKASNPINGFPYIHWINRTKGTGLRTIHFPKGAWLSPSESRNGRWTRIAPPGTKALYGETPNWHWTGTPGFFSKAVDAGRVYHVKVQRQVVQDMLSAKV